MGMPSYSSAIRWLLSPLIFSMNSFLLPLETKVPVVRGRTSESSLEKVSSILSLFIKEVVDRGVSLGRWASTTISSVRTFGFSTFSLFTSWAKGNERNRN